MDSIFRCQFPSAVIGEDLRLVYIKSELDDAFKDKRFAEDIKVELLFGQLTDSSEEEGCTLPLIIESRMYNPTPNKKTMALFQLLVWPHEVDP